MRLTFLGGADEVGASSTLVEIGGKRLLIDAGIRVSSGADRSAPRGDQLPDLQRVSDAGGVDFILVTHAHTDHTGALALVVERYPDVHVLATQPTIDLVRVLQSDAQKIMRSRQDDEGELPLYDAWATDRLMNAFVSAPFGYQQSLGGDLEVVFFPAGHIAGAASLVLQSSEGRVVMSGDVSMTAQRAVERATVPSMKADVLVLESTYGGRLHANRVAEEKRLIDRIRKTAAAGGKVLIPAFALGRAQEILQILLAHLRRGEMPVYVDGMVRSVCAAYGGFKDVLPSATVEAAGTADLFFRDGVKAVRSAKERYGIVERPGPAVIVSSSGMLVGGPSAFYAWFLASDPKNAILLTGYQDEESPGRFVQRLAKDRGNGMEVPVRLDGKVVTLRCALDSYSLSAHADESELVSFAENFDAERIALVHGDASARRSLAAQLERRGRKVMLPAVDDVLNYPSERVGRAAGQNRNVPGRGKFPVDVAQLWELLKGSAGSVYTVRQLTMKWAGDAERADEMRVSLIADGVYFQEEEDGRFRMADQAGVALARRRADILKVVGDVAGRLLVFRNIDGNVRVGIGVEVSQGWVAVVSFGPGGDRYPVDSLVWNLGKWRGTLKMGRVSGELSEFVRRAVVIRHGLLPLERREALVAEGLAVDPVTLLPELLPEGVSEQMALLAIVWLLAEDGAELRGDRLLPVTIRLKAEPMILEHVGETTVELLSGARELSGVRYDSERHRIVLADGLSDEYREVVDELVQVTGWAVQLGADEDKNAEIVGESSPSADSAGQVETRLAEPLSQKAQIRILLQLLPEGGKVVHGPYFKEEGVEVELGGVDDVEGLARQYQEQTGAELLVRVAVMG